MPKDARMSAVKTLFSRLYLTLPLCLGLSACSSGPGEEEFAPQILAIYSDIIHRHPSFYEKWPERTQRSIDFHFSINISDPQGIGDILKVDVRDLNDNVYWNMFDAREVNPWSRCFRGAGVFECRFYPGNHPDYANLKNLEVVVQDLSGYTRRQRFNHLLADGDQPDQQSFVYSAQYSGSTENGYPALRLMTSADNDLVFESSPGSQSFHVEFTVDDHRATHYSVDFYDDTDAANYVGSVPQNAPSISSKAFVVGQTLVNDIPWSEIEFEDGFSVADIKHMHITLYDSPIPWIINGNDEGLWFNHLSTSEMVSLP
jgi:hypothetical protein